MTDDYNERLTKTEAYFEAIVKQFEEIKTGVHEINVTLTGNSHGYKHGLVYKTDETHQMLLQHLEDCKTNKDADAEKKKSRQQRIWDIIKPILLKISDYAIALVLLIVMVKLGFSGLIDFIM